MKIGAQEILIVVLVIMAILIITRIIRIGRSTVRRDEDTRPEVMMSQFEHKTYKMFAFFTKLGIALAAVGVILMILSIALASWTMASYMWSAIAIVVGAIMFLIFRRKG
jgi:steroid 5-alpha reductase family enzyme